MSAIELSGVSLRYRARHGDVLALDDVALQLPSGSFTCIVGASGCGKSTLLRAMAGLEEPTEGAIRVGGELVRGPSRDRGMVFQTSTLYPWLRVRENVAFGPRLGGLPRREREAQAIALLDELGIGDFADAYPGELSGGMQQRVAIARALATHPGVLLMDEPFGALDALTRRSAQSFLLEAWSRHPRTIAFVTHDIEEAVLLADRVVVMTPRPGRVQALVPVELPRPRTHATRDEPAFRQLVRELLAMVLKEASADGLVASS
ncbi:MAG TPA: ABC transporter ATP-binding protein [Conexibacter sp.]|nr:ABC transporter ATP-binding protein [Conexibacter sp.]